MFLFLRILDWHEKQTCSSLYCQLVVYYYCYCCYYYEVAWVV